MGKRHNRIGFVLSIFAILVTLACGFISSSVVSVPGMPETLAAKTWSAMETSAFLKITPTDTQPPPSNTPTVTDTPTATRTPTPTNTPVPPLTLLPTNTSLPPTLTPVPTILYFPPYYYPPGGGLPPGSGPGNVAPCYAARLVRHVTIPNDEILPPSLNFSKVWQIENVGSCTWDTSIKMVLVDGNAMGGTSVNLPSKVKPGKSVNISIPMKSPASEGMYTGLWKLKHKTKVFGDNNNPFKVKIVVETDAQGTIFNFASNFCSARWKSNKYSGYLPCPGKAGTSKGFVVKLNHPHMENGESNEPGLWSHPPLTNGGEIWGAFPSIYIDSNESFQAELACLHGYTHCHVTFTLYYQIYGNSEKVLLGQWIHTYGDPLDVDLPLSSLASKYVSFIFVVEGHGNHPEDNAAFWHRPRITR